MSVLSKMMTVAILLKAVDQVTGPLKQVVRSIDEVSKAADQAAGLRNMGQSMQMFGLQALGASAAIGAALRVPVNAYADLEDAQTRARVAFMTGAGIDPQFKKVADQAVRLGNLLPGNTADFMQMAAAMKEVGVATDAIANGGLEAAADLRVLLGNMNPEDAGRMVGVFRQSLGIANQDFVKFIDLVQRAKFGFGLDPQDFAYTAQYMAPIAKQLGMTGLDSARGMLAFAGAMSQAGIKGEELGTSLRETFLQLPDLASKLKPGTDAITKLNAAGIQLTFFDKSGNFQGFQNFVEQISKLNKLSPQARLSVLSDLFGTRAAGVLSTIASKGTAGYNSVLQQMAAQASLGQRITEVLGTFRSLTDAAKGTLINTFAAAGATVAPLIKRIAVLLNTLADFMGRVIDHHQTLVKWMMIAAGVLAGLLFAFGAVTLVIGTFVAWTGFAIISWTSFGWALKSTGTMITAATQAVRTLTTALMANPITALISLVLLLGITIYRNWSGIVGSFKAAWFELGKFLTSIMPSWRSAGANMMHAITAGIVSAAMAPIRAVRAVAQRIRNHFNFSPAKEGPLRDLHRIKFSETIAQSMRTAPAMAAASRVAKSMRIAAASAAIAATPAAAASSSGGHGPIAFTYAPQYTLSAGSAPDLVDQLKKINEVQRAEMQKWIGRVVDAEFERRERKRLG